MLLWVIGVHRNVNLFEIGCPLGSQLLGRRIRPQMLLADWPSEMDSNKYGEYILWDAVLRKVIFTLINPF